MLPVSKTLHGVMDMLSEIKTIDIKEIEKKGLKNNIEFVDKDGGSSTFSHITSDGQVVLSLSYCQLLWNLCYVALKNTELLQFEDSCSYFHIPSALIKDVILKTDRKEFEYLSNVFSAKDDFTMLRIGANCLGGPLSSSSLKELEDIPQDTAFSQTVNGLCSAAINFVLLHELFHWERGHFSKAMRRIDKEREADNYAFDTIQANYHGRLKNTGELGALCALGSFFFLNPNFDNDGRYPFEDERLFAQFDKIKGNRGRNLIIDSILSFWASLFHKDVLEKIKMSANPSERIEILREALSSIGRA